MHCWSKSSENRLSMSMKRGWTWELCLKTKLLMLQPYMYMWSQGQFLMRAGMPCASIKLTCQEWSLRNARKRRMCSIHAPSVCLKSCSKLWRPCQCWQLAWPFAQHWCLILALPPVSIHNEPLHSNCKCRHIFLSFNWRRKSWHSISFPWQTSCTSKQRIQILGIVGLKW